MSPPDDFPTKLYLLDNSCCAERKLIKHADFPQNFPFAVLRVLCVFILCGDEAVTFHAASYANLAAHLRKILLHMHADKHARELLNTTLAAGRRQQSLLFMATHTRAYTGIHSFPQETKFSLAALK